MKPRQKAQRPLIPNKILEFQKHYVKYRSIYPVGAQDIMWILIFCHDSLTMQGDKDSGLCEDPHERSETGRKHSPAGLHSVAPPRIKGIGEFESAPVGGGGIVPQ